MDKENKPQRRASLRGKGREILLGQQGDTGSPDADEASGVPGAVPGAADAGIDAAALALTAEEADALLDLSPDASVYGADLTFPDPSPSRPDVPSPRAAAAPVMPDEDDATQHDWFIPDDGLAAEPDEMLPPAVRPMATLTPDWLDKPKDETAAFGADFGVDDDGLALSRDLDDYPLLGGDAVPLAERSPVAASEMIALPYRAAPAVDALVPVVPEIWTEDGLDVEPVTPDEILDDDHEGGAYEGYEDVVEPPAAARPLIPDPFAPKFERPPASEVFAETAPADGNLLTMLVNDERIQRLADQIDALHEEIAGQFHGDQQTADAYQQELLQASSKLMASRENYDDARAIVYRIRADMNRRRKVEEAIDRYRPALLLYYVGWGISLVVLFLLKALFTGVTDAVGIETAAAMYYPMLLGIAGALLSGFLTLERHTTRLRDFDPIHISWYMLNPFLGGVMGLLMFLLASIANEDLLRESASDAEHAITYLLCVVAGMNQNNVLRQLNDLLKRFGRGGGGQAE